MSDAHAFLRNILANPSDPVARLVFADWLEESGRKGKSIWAEYIRLADALWRAEGDEAQELKRQLQSVGKRVRYRIRIGAGHFLTHLTSLENLLPVPQWTVDLDGLTIPPEVIESMPESAAREDQAIPLQVEPDRLVVALGRPITDFVHNRLLFIFNREVAAVRTDPEQIVAAHARYYSGTESVAFTSCVLYLSPEEGDPSPIALEPR